MNTVARQDDTRVTMDRLVWLLAALAMVTLPYTMYMPAWIPLFFFVMAAWRLVGMRRGWGMAPAWLRMGAALLTVIAIGVEYRAFSGQDAGTAMIVVLMSLKLTETVTRRDCVVLVFIAYMLVIGNFLYSQSMFMGLYMLFAVWFITAYLLHLMHPTTGIGVRDRARIAAGLLAQALPIMVVLFILFPRVPGPLWGVPAGQQAVTGVGDSMEPGSVSALGTSFEVAFRVHFDGDMPQHKDLYWRGPVLRHFDGRRWSMGHEPRRDFQMFETRGDPVHYEVVLEPHRERWLFALDLPAEVPQDAAITRAWNLLAEEPVRDRRRYAIHSYTDYATGPERSRFEIDRALRLPDGGNPRARELAREWRDATGDMYEVVDAALAMFRERDFWYTLNPPSLGADSVDEFLFDTRRGFCEHYAGSFTFLMRAAGIPARIVLGYQGGEYNPVGDYLIVRQSSAHAWVEVLDDEAGWVRVDPTGAVAPERIEQGLDALVDLEGREGMGLRGIAALNRLWLHIDDLNNRWNLFVLGYDRESQREFVARFGLQDADYASLAVALAVVLAALSAVLTAWLLWQNRPATMRDPAVRLYHRLQAMLERTGVEPAARGEGPASYAGRAAQSVPACARHVRDFMDDYLDYRYGRRPDPKSIERLRRSNKSLRASLAVRSPASVPR